MQSHHTKVRRRVEPADPESLERGVRQLLADKVSGTLVGLWLLVPEHLRLGTWELLRTWTGEKLNWDIYGLDRPTHRTGPAASGLATGP